MDHSTLVRQFACCAFLLMGCPTRPAPTTTPVDPEPFDCAPLLQAIRDTARAEAACTADAECGRREIPVCDVDGVGCYFHITHMTRSRQSLDEALAAYTESICPQAECDCAAPPSAFSCVDGQCVVNPTPGPVGNRGEGSEIGRDGALSRAAEALTSELSWTASDYTTEVHETDTTWEVTFRLPAPTPPGGEAMVIVDKRTGAVVVHPGE